MTRGWRIYPTRVAVAGALAVLALGGCGGNADQANKELAKARAQIKQERDAAQGELATTRQQLADERQRVADAKAQVATEQARLDRLKGEVSGARATISKNTIPGDGTFEVGKDIVPGTYRAAAQSGCYWARLSSLNTSDIIDNNNADGPVVIQVLASDKALELSGCAELHKSG